MEYNRMLNIMSKLDFTRMACQGGKIEKDGWSIEIELDGRYPIRPKSHWPDVKPSGSSVYTMDILLLGMTKPQEGLAEEFVFVAEWQLQRGWFYVGMYDPKHEEGWCIELKPTQFDLHPELFAIFERRFTPI